MIRSEAVLGLPGYQITGINEVAGKVRITARQRDTVSCPHCQSHKLRLQDKRWRKPRHESWGLRHCVLELESCKYRCRDCGRRFGQRFPGILPRKRATEPFRRSVFVAHWNGVNRSRLGQREDIGSATVERWFQDYLRREDAERKGAPCPRVLGIDEHFFSRKDGYATTFCDLRTHTIFDVVLGTARQRLEEYLAKLPGKERVQVGRRNLWNGFGRRLRRRFWIKAMKNRAC